MRRNMLVSYLVTEESRIIRLYLTKKLRSKQIGLVTLLFYRRICMFDLEPDTLRMRKSY